MHHQAISTKRNATGYVVFSQNPLLKAIGLYSKHPIISQFAFLKLRPQTVSSKTEFLNSTVQVGFFANSPSEIVTCIPFFSQKRGSKQFLQRKTFKSNAARGVPPNFVREAVTRYDVFQVLSKDVSLGSPSNFATVSTCPNSKFNRPRTQRVSERPPRASAAC